MVHIDFRVHGNVYHRISTSLLPNAGSVPNFAQIYVYDAAQAAAEAVAKRHVANATNATTNAANYTHSAPNGINSTTERQMIHARELQSRHSIATYTSIETLGLLQQMMHEISPYVQQFMTMAQLDAETPGGLPDISMVFKSENTPDPRRYNAPTNSTEIGILILESGSRDSTETAHRDVVLRLRDNNNNDLEETAITVIIQVHLC
jgi:hypothetical protein